MYLTTAGKIIPNNILNRQNNKIQNKEQTIHNKKWYNKECKALKRKLNSTNKSLQRDPKNYEKRILFFQTQKI